MNINKSINKNISKPQQPPVKSSKCFLAYINKVNNDILTRDSTSPKYMKYYPNYEEEYKNFVDMYEIFNKP